MFKKNFIRLCNEKGVSPSAVCRAVGLTPAAYSCWTEDSIPRKATLLKIADFFGVTVESLIDNKSQSIQTISNKTNSSQVKCVSQLDKDLISIISNLSDKDKEWLFDLIKTIVEKRK